MHTLISSDPGEIAAQRRAVAFAVSRHVPGDDPELATHHGLERLFCELAISGDVERPVNYWHNAEIDAGTGASAAEATTTELPGVSTTAVAPTTASQPSGETTETPVRPELPPSIAPAGDSAGLPQATRRSRRARYETVPSFVERRTAVPDPAVCRSTRGAMHDYIRHRLLPCRRRELEDHLVDCTECVRAFTDVRESYWLQQAAAPVIRLGTVSVTSTPAMARSAAVPAMARVAARG